MNILILMAGEGKRFSDVGVAMPKPLVEVNGKTILEWTTRSIPFIKHYGEEGDHFPSNQLYFAVRESHEQEYNLTNRLKLMYGDDINLIYFKKSTRGNLETAYICAALMEDDEALLVLDSDNKYTDNEMLTTFTEALDFEHSMVVNYFDPIDDDTKWAFAYTDGAVVKKIVEKDPNGIKNGGSPLIGNFWFSTVKIFLRWAQYIITEGLVTGIPGKEEFYISQIPAIHAANKGAVFAHKVSEVVPLGTPEDVEKFRNANML